MGNVLRFRQKNCLWAIFFSLLLGACHKSDDPLVPDADRTILVYLATDNSLDSYARQNIADMLEGMEGVNGRVVIYMDSRYDAPVLMTMEKQGKHYVLDTLEKYSEENSASPEVLRRVANRARELYPASSYGLILGSHGTGWIPANVWFTRGRMLKQKAENAPLTRLFGEDMNQGGGDVGRGMNIPDLVDALPEGYHFILFDACLMSNIEIAYALRHKAEYIIASPAEILVDGFPYKKVMPLLWGDEQGLREACKEFRNYYENHSSGGAWRSGTIALVRTAFLDGLAKQVKEVLNGRTGEIAGMSPADVWRYPLIDYTQDVFFDLGAYVRKMASDSQYSSFETLVDRAVYRLATTSFNNTAIPADKYSGLTVYIPLGRWASANNEYFNLEWAQYVYGE